jgi:hypothetical protein
MPQLLVRRGPPNAAGLVGGQGASECGAVGESNGRGAAAPARGAAARRAARGAQLHKSWQRRGTDQGGRGRGAGAKGGAGRARQRGRGQGVWQPQRAGRGWNGAWLGRRRARARVRRRRRKGIGHWVLWGVRVLRVLGWGKTGQAGGGGAAGGARDRGPRAAKMGGEIPQGKTGRGPRRRPGARGRTHAAAPGGPACGRGSGAFAALGPWRGARRSCGGGGARVCVRARARAQARGRLRGALWAGRGAFIVTKLPRGRASPARRWGCSAVGRSGRAGAAPARAPPRAHAARGLAAAARAWQAARGTRRGAALTPPARTGTGAPASSGPPCSPPTRRRGPGPPAATPRRSHRRSACCGRLGAGERRGSGGARARWAQGSPHRLTDRALLTAPPLPRAAPPPAPAERSRPPAPPAPSRGCPPSSKNMMQAASVSNCSAMARSSLLLSAWPIWNAPLAKNASPKVAGSSRRSTGAILSKSRLADASATP